MIQKLADVELITPFGKSEITHVIHDIDGTHSLIRDWQPTMSACMHWAMTGGLKQDFDSEKNVHRLINRVGKEVLEETDRYCVECAGFSAITQMEFAIRRAIEEGNIPDEAGLDLTTKERANNSAVIQRIWKGEETFDEVQEPKRLTNYLNHMTPRLFKFYEKVLNGACRDRNTEEARKKPERWRVPGSLEFLSYLNDIGCINYFVTGAVIYQEGGMFEEVEVLGFKIGPDKMIKSLKGSSWNKKMPKDEVMEKLFVEDGIDPNKTLIIGDGRTEIKAGVSLGSITISRLAETEKRQREIHIKMGTNLIIRNYLDPCLKNMVYKSKSF
jgi:hypothetical protein